MTLAADIAAGRYALSPLSHTVVVHTGEVSHAGTAPSTVLYTPANPNPMLMPSFITDLTFPNAATDTTHAVITDDRRLSHHYPVAEEKAETAPGHSAPMSGADKKSDDLLSPDKTKRERETVTLKPGDSVTVQDEAAKK